MEPWERQKGESAKAFHAFTHYRDLGPERSRDKAFRGHLIECVGHESSTGAAPGTWTLWSSKWKWSDRVAAYDADLDRQQRERREREILEAKDRHANLARLMQNKFLEGMRNLVPSDIPLSVLVQMIRVATDIELRSLGEPTVDFQVRHQPEENLSERIARYVNLVRDIASGALAGDSHGNGTGEPLDSPRSN